MYIISGILAIGIPRFNTVLQMLQLDNFLGFLGWKRQRKTKRSESRRMSTGLRLTLPKRMGLGVDVVVTQTSGMSKAKKVAVLPNGSMLQGVGHHLDF